MDEAEGRASARGIRITSTTALRGRSGVRSAHAIWWTFPFASEQQIGYLFGADVDRNVSVESGSIVSDNADPNSPQSLASKHPPASTEFNWEACYETFIGISVPIDN